MDEPLSFRDRLETEHDFPGSFTFKVIGPNTETFASLLRAALDAACPGARAIWSRRESAKGKYASITVEAVLPSADAVLDVYERFQQIEGVKLVL